MLGNVLTRFRERDDRARGEAVDLSLALFLRFEPQQQTLRARASRFRPSYTRCCITLILTCSRCLRGLGLAFGPVSECHLPLENTSV